MIEPSSISSSSPRATSSASCGSPPSEGGPKDGALGTLRWIAGPEDRGARLDRFLSAQDLDATRSQLKKMIDSGHAFVDGAPARPSRKLADGQVVLLILPAPAPSSALPEDIPLDIRYEDDSLVVLVKPCGLVVHPAPGHPSGTLVNGLLHACSAAGGDPLRPGIVHRLDKDTSGLMVVAKDEAVHADLAGQFHERSVERSYLALVAGDPPQGGEWRSLHGRRPGDRRLFSSKVKRGKPAISLFRTMERFPGAALLEVSLRTGRTHQVRVHCRDNGLPCLGDRWYGPRRLSDALRAIHERLPGQGLHAGVLGFTHPRTGERLSFEAEPPPAFAEALSTLRSMIA